MLTKFETKSNRVKGLSFHPKRPWILASLHSGVIQLWDYRMGTLIDRFDEHDGPVRGIHFHKSQPLFVSGGDDYKIKVWNYKLRRCLFTLLGHLDYIRTVQFHNEYPWIVSASDDQTIRIWNWQSRNCVSVLTGHNHYVMCAAFHPKDDLVVSASLDQTVRVWDIGALRKKSVAPGGGGDDITLRIPQMNLNLQVQNELFGGGDAVVKYVLEGHDRGVNWAAFHPSLPLIVSGADDRQVKLWRYNETKAWEVDTLRGHTNNVSCVMFHARQDLIISNSEDKSIRVWDMSKRTGVQTFRREHDRFWILSAHPDINLLAAGHDGGMIVFKLERERPAYALHGSTLYYVKDRYLRTYDLAQGRDNPLIALRRPPTTTLNSAPRSLSYNPAEHAVLLTGDAEGGSFELYQLPKDTGRGESSPDGMRGQGASAVFIARNRFAVLDRAAGVIQVRNLANEVTKKCPPPCATVDALFYAGTGLLLCRAEDRVVLFDVQQRAALAELPTPPVKYVVWNSDMSAVALLSKHAIVVADKRLGGAATVHETIRVKSAAWDDSGVLIYTTLNHLKYCLPNGDSGIIRTLESPLYVVRAANGTVTALDREGRVRSLAVEPAEYGFKLALSQNRFEDVLSLIRSGGLCGAALIAYLQSKGYPEVALHFVADEATRFSLALACGNIEVALQAAQALDERDTWYRLGIEALRQGNFGIVEFSYQKTKSFERLAFLYLVTGQAEKLRKMLKIAEMRGDVMGRAQNALYLGDMRELVRVLEESGQAPLAYVAAGTYGLEEEAARIREGLPEESLPPLPAPGAASLLLPPAPIVQDDNWPLLTVAQGFFEMLAAKGAAKTKGGAGGAAAAAAAAAAATPAAAAAAGLEELQGAGWGDDDADDALGGDGLGGSGDGDGGWDVDDLELPADLGIDAAAAAASGAAGDEGPYLAPAPGVPPPQRWLERRGALAAEHCAAGQFSSAMQLLHRQLGAVDFEALKPHMLELYYASHATLPGLPGVPPVLSGLDRGWSRDAATQPPSAPALLFSLARLEDDLKAAYKLVTEGKFSDALRAFQAMLRTIPLLVVESRKEVDDAKELVVVCREYATGLLCELKRKELAGDEANAPRAAELAAYFTHCQLQPMHLALSLRSAMAIFFKLRNFATAATFARRLLELKPGDKMAASARQVLAACEKTPTDELPVNYDPRNPFDICTITFTPIYRGSKFAEDRYTGAKFQPSCEGQVSPIGEFCRVGADAGGLVVSPSQLR
ncbi:coatomer subunit alpha [Raphidocelis subcapitata]|uniref:Coatomer subunit alpha n=1 Tax=Raphidocelis subcapitata TaxID=307507 RepID=A0A2V0NNU2_9CHLO|nr:coatomer subunit alpha [Raphidocelis subcapitata]|eukprot:GBF89236.1 coatomer subunit alpha [Raphidocelis subcapitata]